MSERNGLKGGQLAAIVIVAALGGFVLGRLSTHLNLRMDSRRGGAAQAGGELDLNSTEFLLADPGPPATDSDLLPVGELPFLGPAAAKVTIVEFSDFECPFCSRVLPAVHQIMADFSGDVRLVYLNLPLPMHDNAELAAQAALAAGEQGKFWEFHDLMFENQRSLSRQNLVGYAEELQLDVEAFEEALDDGRFASTVQQHKELARRFNLNGTPAFLINGVEVVGAQPYDAFRAVVEAEIEAADALISDGVDISEVYQLRVAANRGEEQGRIDVPAGTAPVETAAAVDAPRHGAGGVPHSDLLELDPTLGQTPGGAVALTVYADVTSADYRSLGQTLRLLSESYGERLRVDFVSFVDTGDTTAVLYAGALLTAHELGTFWELHDAIIALEAYTVEGLGPIAADAGVDLASLQAQLSNGSLQLRVAELRSEAVEANIVLAPTVVVGNVHWAGNVPYTDLVVALNTAFGG